MNSPMEDVQNIALMSTDELLQELSTNINGLDSTEAARRVQEYGPNTVHTHRMHPLALLGRQLASPLLALLAVAAIVSFFVGERTDAVIIGTIIAVSVGLGFVNEFRAERASEALHSQLRHRTSVRRDGTWTSCDLTDLVLGDVVRLAMGHVVPADVRLLEVDDLEVDESILTGESLAVIKQANSTDNNGRCSMGTIVHRGTGTAVVFATGSSTEFGRVAAGLSDRQEETGFQIGLRRFSMLLARIAASLATMILVINLVLQRPLIDAVLFSLAIAVGITPQLLPAVVTTSLASGSRRLARQRVLVKRLVCIEDLGEVDVLLTDKTGTLTEGEITFERTTTLGESSSDDILLLGLLCNDAVVDNTGKVAGGDPLDTAMWSAEHIDRSLVAAHQRIDSIPFDHDRRIMSVLVDGPEGRRIIVKGAPEAVIERSSDVPDGAQRILDERFATGSRVVAIGVRDAKGINQLDPSHENGIRMVGLLEFMDRPKDSARGALERLASLGITVKVVTGDNGAVASHVCDSLGLHVAGTLTGTEIDVLDDAALCERLENTTIFARVNPEQKARLVRLHRVSGADIAYMGDGVNDAIALHKADVGISVDTATDVARDAADVILLEKNLDVLADGVVEGRRTFANTIKYVLMGTSSNFGNMFSAAAASAFLTFLPMLPSQILLNNLLYDVGQLAIPSDRVDEEQLARPSHWDLRMIRRFMTVFGPVSSLFDFLTFAIMLRVFDAGPDLFRAGWFVESLATQSLVIFVIRTRRVPFFSSRPSTPLTIATVGVVAAAVFLPLGPLASTFGFAHLPADFYAVLALMSCAYLALVEATKRGFFAQFGRQQQRPPARPDRRVHRRASRFAPSP